MKSKKRATPGFRSSTAMLTWPGARPRHPYALRLGEWSTAGGEWPEDLPYGTEDFGDREVVCEEGDDDLVSVLDHDDFGNHSMLKVLDVPAVLQFFPTSVECRACLYTGVVFIWDRLYGIWLAVYGSPFIGYWS